MPRGKDPGPSIKDKERYEALRREGNSKEKSARIANTPRHTAGKRGGEASAYGERTRAELYSKAKQVGIEGRSKMNKGELMDALRHH